MTQRITKTITLAAASAVLTLPSAMAMTHNNVAFTPAQEKAIGSLIEKHITENPDVVAKALQALQAKQMKAELEKGRLAVLKNKTALFSAPDDPTGGNPQGDKVLVLFMDPYCGHCRHFQGVLDEAVKSYPNLKLIYKDLPILGEASQLAVSALFAALEQGQDKYDAFHANLLKTDGAQSKDNLISLAKGAGLDSDAFKKALDGAGVKARIQKNQELAESVGIASTPTLILGDILIPGGVPIEVLKKLLDAKNPDLSAL